MSESVLDRLNASIDEVSEDWARLCLVFRSCCRRKLVRAGKLFTEDDLDDYQQDSARLWWEISSGVYDIMPYIVDGYGRYGIRYLISIVCGAAVNREMCFAEYRKPLDWERLPVDDNGHLTWLQVVGAEGKTCFVRPAAPYVEKYAPAIDLGA